MSLTLVTGASGLVGFHIVNALVHRGRKVRVLLRDPARGVRVIPPEAEVVQGDVTQPDTLTRALEGCSIVHHAAGLPEQWLPDTAMFDKVNVEGTRNLLEASRRAGIEKFIHTSTIDVFEAAAGECFDESRLATAPKGTAYERSKQQADRIVTAAAAEGFHVVITHPSGVYGPGPSGSRTLTQTILDLARETMPALLPGIVPVVFGPDVGEGHLLAEQKGKPGERFILSESIFTLEEIAHFVAIEVGHRTIPPVLPTVMGQALSVVGEFVARWTQQPPLVPAGQFHFLRWAARPVAMRAREVLGWEPTPFAAGLRATVEDFRFNNAL